VALTGNTDLHFFLGHPAAWRHDRERARDNLHRALPVPRGSRTEKETGPTKPASMKTAHLSDSFTSSLRAAAVGLVLAVLTLLFGQGMGIVFGANEDAIKSRLKAAAAEVRDSAYRGDEAALKAVLDKSWVYLQRAHLHAGGMGTTALGLTVLLCLLGTSRRVTAALGAALGAGGLGYSLYWMWAGFRAPALGSTSAAKESLEWLAVPSSGAFVLATVVVLVLLIFTCFRQPSRAANN
jgi:hypothetical protein